MYKRQLSTIILTVILALSAACTNLPPALTPSDTEKSVRNADGYVDINVEQLTKMMDEQQDLILVNVHIPYEGDLPETDLSIPYNEITAHLDQLPAKDAPIVLYCRSGSMSTAAAKELAGLGYTNLMELDGGMNAWTASGHKLVGR
jgi:rhodanese-related sulfurtransferase